MLIRDNNSLPGSGSRRESVDDIAEGVVDGLVEGSHGPAHIN